MVLFQNSSDFPLGVVNALCGNLVSKALKAQEFC